MTSFEKGKLEIKENSQRINLKNYLEKKENIREQQFGQEIVDFIDTLLASNQSLKRTEIEKIKLVEIANLKKETQKLKLEIANLASK